MIIIFLFDYHRDRRRSLNAIRAKVDRLIDKGFPLYRYYHWPCGPKSFSVIYRIWMEFETETEAALFKLTHL